MNRTELVDALATRLGVNKKDAQAAVDGVLDAIQHAVARGEKVAITGFGIFEKVERAARTARNPRTGATVRVRKTSVPKFRAGADFKAFVSGAKKVAKAPARPAAPAKAVAKKAAPVKRTVAKKAAPARKAVAKKVAPARKTVAKKAAPVRKAVATKAAPARKTVAKKAAPVRKAVAKKAPAKRAPAKKAPARRVAKKA